jgi:hypothetical protein
MIPVFSAQCSVTNSVCHGLRSERRTWENSSDILTVNEVAKELRCSKAHVANALLGKIKGLPRLTHMPLGRRKVIRREWLQPWLEANKAR